MRVATIKYLKLHEACPSDLLVLMRVLQVLDLFSLHEGLRVFSVGRFGRVLVHARFRRMREELKLAC